MYNIYMYYSQDISVVALYCRLFSLLVNNRYHATFNPNLLSNGQLNMHSYAHTRQLVRRKIYLFKFDHIFYHFESLSLSLLVVLCTSIYRRMNT